MIDEVAAEHFHAYLGQRVAAAREAAGITRIELSRRTGIPINRLGHLENNDGPRCTVHALVLIADALDCNLYDLVPEGEDA